MTSWYTVKLPYMPLRLAPKVLNTIDMVMLICEQLTVINSVMFKLCYIKRIVASPGVCIKNPIRLYLLSNNWN